MLSLLPAAKEGITQQKAVDAQPAAAVKFQATAAEAAALEQERQAAAAAAQAAAEAGWCCQETCKRGRKCVVVRLRFQTLLIVTN